MMAAAAALRAEHPDWHDVLDRLYSDQHNLMVNNPCNTKGTVQ